MALLLDHSSLSFIALIGLGGTELGAIMLWSVIPWVIYYFRRIRNKERPITGMEYAVTIPLFLIFGWFALLCVWLLALLRQKR